MQTNQDIRLQNPTAIDRSQIESILADGNRPIVQFSAPKYSSAFLEQIDAACAEFGAKLEVRFFGHYGSFDASCLTYLPNVATLSVDCLDSATNIEVLFSLRSLRQLSLGIFRLDRPDILDRMHLENVEKLFVCETRKSNIDLSPVRRSRALRQLHIAGHTRGFATLAQADTISKLSLRSIPKKQSLGVVSDMRGLRTLSLVLGGRADLEDVVHEELEALSVIWVRALASIGSLTRFPALTDLQVEHQPQLETIDLTSASPSLRRVAIFNCKNLRTLGDIAHLRELVELRISSPAVDFEDLLRSPPPSLRCVAFYSGRKKWNDAMRARLDAAGYVEFPR
jgi:hypothetical protein